MYLVYAGALVGEALTVNADLDILMQRAWRDLISAAPFATIGTALWVVIAYFFLKRHRRGHRRARGDPAGGAAALQSSGKSLISRGITMPKLKIMDTEALNAFATGINQKQYSITVTSGLLGRSTTPRSNGYSAAITHTATATCA